MAFLGTGPGRSRAAEFGSQMDLGIGKGISNLLQNKLDRLQQTAAEKEFEAMGYDPQASKLFAKYRNNPQILKLIQEYQGLGGLTGQEEPGMQPGIQEQEMQQEPQMQWLNQVQGQPQNIDAQRAYEMLSNPMSFAQQRMGQVPQQMELQQMQRPLQQQAPMQAQRPQPQAQQPSRGYPSFGSKAKSESLAEQRLISQENKPFLDRHQKELEGELGIRKSAQSALNALQKHKDKFKKQIWFGYPESWYRDPDISNYIADLKGIVNAQSAALPGRGSDYRTRLLEGAKVSINQPLEAQEERLKQIIGSTDYKINEDKELRKIRKENKNEYPRGVSDVLRERTGYDEYGEPAPQQRPSVSSIPPDKRPIGLKAMNKKTNKPVYWDGNEWVDKNPSIK